MADRYTVKRIEVESEAALERFLNGIFDQARLVSCTFIGHYSKTSEDAIAGRSSMHFVAVWDYK